MYPEFKAKMPGQSLKLRNESTFDEEADIHDLRFCGFVGSNFLGTNIIPQKKKNNLLRPMLKFYGTNGRR